MDYIIGKAGYHKEKGKSKLRHVVENTCNIKLFSCNFTSAFNQKNQTNKLRICYDLYTVLKRSSSACTCIQTLSLAGERHLHSRVVDDEHSPEQLAMQK